MLDYEIVGPFSTRCLMVGGRQAPFLEAGHVNSGEIHLTLDKGYGINISV